MVIARLYEGENDSTPPSLKRLLYEVFETIIFNVLNFVLSDLI